VAIERVLAAGHRTPDVGGSLATAAMTAKIVEHVGS